MPSPLRFLYGAFSPGEISLRAYLLFGLLVRLPAVFFSRGYDFLDHQFQYVDPAYHLGLGGSWWRPHDYVQGLRSWVYPGFLGAVFRGLSGLGIEDPVAMMTATRFLHALFGLVPLAALWMLLVRFKPLSVSRPLLLFAAANPILVYSGVQPTAPTFAVGLALTSVFLFHGPGRLWPFLSGIFLGLSFCCRFQDAFFGPVLLLAGLVSGRYRAAGLMSCGAALLVAFQGVIDLFTWGSFLHSPFRYVAWNVFEGAARRYGDEPFWYYLPYLAAALVLLPPFLRSGAEALWNGSHRFPLFLAASTFYLLMHHLVAHKAIRFVLPALVLLLLLYASDLLDPDRSVSRLRAAHRALFLGVHSLALVFVSFWYPHRGPVEAALALSRRADFVDRLVVVDGEESDVGGHYYLRRPRIDVSLVERRNLYSWIRANRPGTPLYFLVTREPLDSFEPPPPYRLERVGDFRNWPDWQSHARRTLYRLSAPSAEARRPSEFRPPPATIIPFTAGVRGEGSGG